MLNINKCKRFSERDAANLKSEKDNQSSSAESTKTENNVKTIETQHPTNLVILRERFILNQYMI